MIPTIPTVWLLDAWLTVAFTSLFVASPTAVPAAATSAVSRTAVPVAVSQPKNAAPIWMPPNCSFSRATTLWRVGTSSTTGCPADPVLPGRRQDAGIRAGWCGALGVRAVLPGIVDAGICGLRSGIGARLRGRAVFGAYWAAHVGAHFH